MGTFKESQTLHLQAQGDVHGYNCDKVYDDDDCSLTLYYD